MPGYLLLWPKPTVTSVAELADDTVTELGPALRSAVAAIRDAVEAERVYVLCLAELEPRVHFHLFPRTAKATEIFRRQTGYAAAAINGLVYMQWAREFFAWNENTDAAEVSAVIDRVRARLSA